MSLTDTQRATLRLFCDTIVPRIERDADPDGFWARTATDLGVPEASSSSSTALDERAAGRARPAARRARLAGLRRASPSQLSREQVLRNMSLASPEAAGGIAALTGMTLFLNYGAPDPQTGQNPNWQAFGYPGPAGAAAAGRRSRSQPLVPERRADARGRRRRRRLGRRRRA